MSREEDAKNYARMLQHVADCVLYYQRMSALPNCNDCGIENECEYRPEWGAPVRVNCPLWKKGADKK